MKTPNYITVINGGRNVVAWTCEIHGTGDTHNGEIEAQAAINQHVARWHRKEED